MHTAAGQMNHSSHEALGTVAPRPDEGVLANPVNVLWTHGKFEMRSKLQARVHKHGRGGHVGSHVELLDHRISEELLLKAVFSKPLVVFQTFLHGLAEGDLVLLLPFSIRLVHQVLIHAVFLNIVRETQATVGTDN